MTHLRAWCRPLPALLLAACALVFGYANSFGLDVSRHGFVVSPLRGLALRFVLFALVFAVSVVAADGLVELVASRRRVAADEEEGASPDALGGGATPEGVEADARDPEPQGRASREGIRRAATWLVPRFEPRSVLMLALLVFLLWLPYACSMYPAAMGFDSYYMIYQCYPHADGILINPGNVETLTHHMFVDHHPLFDSLVFGLFARLSDAATGSWNYGIFAFCLLQAFGMALALVATIAWTERAGAPDGLRIGLVALVALLPFFPIYAAALLKDSFHGIFFLWFLLCCCEALRTRGASLSSGRGLVALTVIALLVCLTKKTGIYLVVLSLAVPLVALRRTGARLVAPLACAVLVMYVVLPRLVFPLLDVVPGGEQEKYGFALQQTARWVVICEDEVSDEDRQVIDAVIPYEDMRALYNPEKTDDVKDRYRFETCTADDWRRWRTLWLREGLRHPRLYVESVVATVNHFFDLYGSFTVYTTTPTPDKGYEFSKFHTSGLFDGLHRRVVKTYRWLTDASPVPLRLLFRVGLWAFWLPAVCACILARRSRWLLVALVPVWCSLLFLLVSPVFYPRYALNMVLACPMLLGLAAGAVWRDVVGPRVESDAG